MGPLRFSVVLEFHLAASHDDLEIIPLAFLNVFDAGLFDVEFQAAEIEVVVAFRIGQILELDVDIPFEFPCGVDHHIAFDLAVDDQFTFGYLKPLLGRRAADGRI